MNRMAKPLHFGVFMLTTFLAAPAAVPEVVPEATDGQFCTTCHGSEGQGNEMVNAPRIAGMERWYLERQMNLFREGLRGTHPEDLQGMEMQPQAAILSDEMLEQALDRVESWPYEPAPVTLEDGDASAGEQVYQSCATCHGAEAGGNETMNAPALVGQNDWYLVTQLENFREGYRGYDSEDTAGNQMRVMVQNLSDEDIRDVVAYINTLGR